VEGRPASSAGTASTLFFSIFFKLIFLFLINN